MPSHRYPPRHPLIHAPTPLEAMPRLSAALAGADGGAELYVKRDDCSGLALGGNKARKLEFLLAEAIADGADMLLTAGGVQSNHCRQTAAAAARVGLDCQLLLQMVPGSAKAGAEAEHYASCGNLLLDQLFGAECHWLPASADLDEALASRAELLRAAGRRPCLIPVGGSSPLGALGYAACAEELLDQASAADLNLDAIVLASGSAGTQAGLLAGLAARGSQIPVLGFCVSRDAAAQEAKVHALLLQTCALLDIPAPARDAVRCDGGHVGDGYGITSDGMREALRLTARSEGLLLDPVYTGKAMAGLIDHCRRGLFPSGQRVLFLHTGGAPGLFGYTGQLA